MRVSRVQIDSWRNFRDVEIVPPADAAFICLVGENGSGKSSVLELIHHALHHCGLAPSMGIRRAVIGNGHPMISTPPSHSFSVTIDLKDRISLSEFSLAQFGFPTELAQSWDGTLSLTSKFWTDGREAPDATPTHHSTPHGQPGDFEVVVAGGFTDTQQGAQCAQAVINQLRTIPSLLHLFIDAERYFPNFSIEDSEIIALSRQDFDLPDWIRQQASQATQNLYTEWMREMLGRQQRLTNQYFQSAIEASSSGQQIPPPRDIFTDYRDKLLRVLPHLRFERLDQDARRLVYTSGSSELPYESLSAGERELAFLVGQLTRFGIREGIFLLDEPELHLNNELLRTWVGFLREQIAGGQAWIATHSLEAAEMAGPEACFVMERNEARLVDSIVPLGSRPALATLAAQVGTPAFAVGRSRFVLIEGTRERRERERFVSIIGPQTDIRYVEADSCSEVVRRVNDLRRLSSEEEQIKVLGVVDWDFRSLNEQTELREAGVITLQVQEVENFFLEPRLLTHICHEHGQSASDDVLRSATNAQAGSWSFERAKVDGGWSEGLGKAPANARQVSWEPGFDTAVASAAIASGFEGLTPVEGAKRRVALQASLEEFCVMRTDNDRLWRECFGKEALKVVARSIGYSGSASLEARAAVLWRDSIVPRPDEAIALLQAVQEVAVLA